MWAIAYQTFTAKRGRESTRKPVVWKKRREMEEFQGWGRKRG